MTIDKLSIANEMAAFDLKDRNFFDDLNEEEKKKFAPYLMIRWGATVDGDSASQVRYLMATNENLNTHFFDISSKDHKKLHWLMATTVSPGEGKKYHKWLAAAKKDKANSKGEKVLEELFPHLKPDDIKLLAKLNDKDNIKSLARKHGWTDERIRKDL